MGNMCRIKMLKGVILATKDWEGLGLVSGSTSPHLSRCELSATADYLYFWPIQVFDYLKSPKGSLGKTAGCFSLLDMKDMKGDASRSQWEILKEAEEKENRVGRRSVAVALWK